jgi:hypothetical protein
MRVGPTGIKRGGTSCGSSTVASGANTGSAHLADDAAVGTDAGSAGIDVKASTQSAGRAGQVAQNNGTHFAGQANVRVTVVGDSSRAVKTDSVFKLENSFQAIAQIFRTLETDVGRVGRNAIEVTNVVRPGSGTCRRWMTSKRSRQQHRKW